VGITERKARQRRDLKRRILQAAEELFVREGYENVSMRKIAAKIEYSPTTIYRLFRNKAEIMDQLIAEGYRGVYERYEEILARRPDSPFATLSLIIGEYVTFALDNPNHYRLWFATGELRLRDGELQMRHGDISYRVYGTWLDRIDECKAAGSLPNRDTLALFQLIWGSVHGLISLRIHHSDFPWLPLHQHIAEVLSLLKRGLTPEPGGVPARGGGNAI
jgi:AcrR family transcriptional regulator